MVSEKLGKKVFTLFARGEYLLKGSFLAEEAKKGWLETLNDIVEQANAKERVILLASTSASLFFIKKVYDSSSKAITSPTWAHVAANTAKATAWSLLAVAGAVVTYSTCLDVLG
jgi:hypothetical protein